MRATLALLALFLLLPAAASSAPVLPAPPAKLESYLGDLTGFDASVPTPASTLGFEPGEWHVRHDALVRYFERLAAASPKVRLVEYGRTFTGRPLIAAIIASPDRIANLEQVRASHLASLKPDAKPAGRPAVTWLGYGVHGNEPSTSNAALVVAYWLAASPEADALLRDVIFILDPCLNPEGLERFANWANGHRGSQLVADPDHREHREGWPTGRLNHFWFDLNRDYLPLAQQESLQRMRFYLSWNPDLNADWHEMGTNSSYFFQPGHPARNHPARAADVDALTTRIAAFHTSALGEIGSLYYTRDRFDDFYIGKASTYPDVTGSVGILYEQASSRGHIQSSINGDLTFPFTLRNQVATSLSTARAAAALRADLTSRRAPFYAAAPAEAAAAGIAGWHFTSPEDPARARLLADLLAAHGAKVEPTRDGGHWVPAAQPLFRFLNAALEERTEFEDTTFYDISAWNLAHAYGVQLRILPSGAELPLTGAQPPAPPANAPAPDAYAWLVDWRDHAAGPLLQRLQAAGAHVRVSLRPLRAASLPDTEWPAGTLILPASLQADRSATHALLAAAAPQVRIASVDARMSLSGPDLGGDDVLPLSRRSVVLATGTGVNANEAGAVWFILDQRIGAPVSLLEINRLGSLRNDRHTTLILAHGTYSSIDDATVDSLKRWVSGGGTLIALGSAARWAAEKGFLTAEPLPDTPMPRSDSDTYGDLELSRGVHRISGVILAADTDLSHPLAFGLGRSRLSLFADSSLVFKLPRDTRTVPLRFPSAPLVAGYASNENLQRFAGNAAAIAQRSGSGAVVLCPWNPAFRGHWHGTEKFLLNAIHFAPVLRSGSAPAYTDGD